MPTCQHCGIEVQSRGRGRPAKYCSDRCRKAKSRKGNLRTKKRIVTDSTGLRKTWKKNVQKQSVACPEIEFSEKTPLRFEQVNEVTWKLTDGTHTDVPASPGKWGGYRTTKAVAWVMEVGPKQWVARCDDMGSQLLPLAEAKNAAKRMVVSGLYDYLVTDANAPNINDLNAFYLDAFPDDRNAIDQTNVVRAAHRIEVISDSKVEPELLRYIMWLECGG